MKKKTGLNWRRNKKPTLCNREPLELIALSQRPLSARTGYYIPTEFWENDVVPLLDTFISSTAHTYTHTEKENSCYKTPLPLSFLIEFIDLRRGGKRKTIKQNHLFKDACAGELKGGGATTGATTGSVPLAYISTWWRVSGSCRVSTGCLRAGTVAQWR